MERIKVTKSRSGLLCFEVGGGAATNTFRGRFIMRSNGQLANAIFIRQHGDLANQLNQAIVPVRAGDLVVEVSGSLPVNFNDPNLSIKTSRIVGFTGNDEEAMIEEVEYPFSTIGFPESVIHGLSQYHNRDGRHFVAQ